LIATYRGKNVPSYRLLYPRAAKLGGQGPALE
jgi:hypothetical protein